LTARARQPIRPFGRIVCSARFVELAGDFDGIASQHERGRLDEGSCCADRISPSMIAMASSFRPNSPAMRYQTDVARSRGSVVSGA
jgi:hypothetical protein